MATMATAAAANAKDGSYIGNECRSAYVKEKNKKLLQQK